MTELEITIEEYIEYIITQSGGEERLGHTRDELREVYSAEFGKELPITLERETEIKMIKYMMKYDIESYVDTKLRNTKLSSDEIADLTTHAAGTKYSTMMEKLCGKEIDNLGKMLSNIIDFAQDHSDSDSERISKLREELPIRVGSFVGKMVTDEEISRLKIPIIMIYKIAIEYEMDDLIVYCTFDDCFTNDEIVELIKYAHKHNREKVIIKLSSMLK